MGRLSNEKKKKLLIIERERIILDELLKSGFIIEQDIIDLLREDLSFGLVTPNDRKNSRDQVLKNIFNCPFLLCDQERLSLNMKKLLPSILKCRYDIEHEVLEYLLKIGEISKEEFESELDMLEYCYYKSSFDGKEILKNGHVKDVVDNVIRVR